MRLLRFWIMPFWVLTAVPLLAEDTAEAIAQEEQDPELPYSADEGDAKDPVITPVSAFPPKKPYERARETLQKAIETWKKRDAKLASEIALEAYDDLLDIRVSPKQKQARQKLLSERRQAAGVYIDSSIAYIQEYVKKKGNTPMAKTEGLSRLGDLRTVSRGYPELNARVTKARQQFE